MNANTQITKLTNERVTLPASFTEAVETTTIKARMLDETKAITSVTNANEADNAGFKARGLQTYIQIVKGLGLAERRPLNDAAANIKRIEDEHIAELLKEKDRLERLQGDFKKAEERRVQEEERIRKSEIARLEQIRLDAERKAQEEKERAELENRKAEEAARERERNIKNKRELEAALKAEEKRKAEAEERLRIANEEAERARQAAAAQQSAIMAPAPVVHKVLGVSTRKVLCYEITDLKAFAAARPDCVKIEPKPSAINAVLTPFGKDATESNPDDKQIPGIKLWWGEKTSTKRF